MSGGVVSAAIRVLARAAAIQLEETAARSARPVSSASLKGKERAHDFINDAPHAVGPTFRYPDVPTSSAHAAPTNVQALAVPNESENVGTSRAQTAAEVSVDARRPEPGPPARALQHGAQEEAKAPRDPGVFPPQPEAAGSTPTPKGAEPLPPLAQPLASTSASASKSTAPKAYKAIRVENGKIPSSAVESELGKVEAGVASAPSQAEAVLPEAVEEEEDAPVLLRASRVPSSRLGRLFHYGSLAASLSLGAASESLRRSTGGTSTGSIFMSDANVRRLVASLSRMRGAALKMGQFMSIQDNNMLPPEVERVLHQVQAQANYMPDWQMEKVMNEELGSNWSQLFSTFDRTPIASASIGQVHRATLPPSTSSTGAPTNVAVKIQFPGIAQSITSDLSNLSMLLAGSAVLPRGLYLQNTIAVMKRELADECDYVREAAACRRFGELLKDDEYFVVPRVVEQGTTGRVLTTEWMGGKPLNRVRNLSQDVRDRIGHQILRLCLLELFSFRFMQTDPNWANFLYAAPTDQIQLVDFGASREYTKQFMDGWWRLLDAAMKGDPEGMKRESQGLGYFTGQENDEMVQAHLTSMSLLASPFSSEGIYDFANQTVTEQVRTLIPVMLKNRLTPPPHETYSLNRKLSGAFLMCAKLGARVDCNRLWKDYAAGYKLGEEV